MHRDPRGTRGRRTHGAGPRRLRHLLVRVRSGRGRRDPRRARGALRRVAHVGWRRVRRAAGVGRGRDPRRHGERVRVGDVAAAAQPAPRWFGGRRRARLRHDGGERRRVRRRRRHLGERGVRRQRRTAVAGTQLLRARAAAHAPLRHDARPLRRGRDHRAGERDPAADVAADAAAHPRGVLRGAHDLRPDVPLRLHAGERRRDRGDHHLRRPGEGPAPAARVHPVVGARRQRSLGPGDLPLLPGARRRVRVVGAPPRRQAAVRDGGDHARRTSTSRCSTTTSRRS